MSPSEPELLAVLHSFLTRLARDREAGCERPLTEYVALWPPEFADLLAGEISALDGGAAALPFLPATIGAYRIDGVLGAGGQGIVYAAYDPRLQRDVALKVLSPALPLSRLARDRFQREALTASRLADPCLCTVLEAGEADGRPFIAMRRIAGSSLAQWIVAERSRAGEMTSAERRRTVERTLRLFEGVARALHAAHLAGVVHRDLKPANLMLEADERLVVLDFGLAALNSGDAVLTGELTMTGAVIGTPAYLPPECLHGTRRADARTDVYALGVTLYEALALRRPFDASTRAALLRAIEHEPVPDLRRDNPQVPADLQAVIETALEKDPQRRYESMQAFADDLERIREHRPIRARPLPRRVRLSRWAQRHPATASATVVAGLAILVALVMLLAFVSELDEQLKHTRSLAMAGASTQVGDRDDTLSLLLAAEAVELAENQTTISALYAATAQARELGALSSDGEVFVAAHFLRGGDIVIAGFEGTIRRMAPELQGAPSFSYRHAGLVRSLQVDASGDRFVSASQDGTALLYDAVSGEARLLRHEQPLYVARPFVLPESLATFEPRERGAILTGAADRARIWPSSAEEPLWVEPGRFGGDVCHVRFAPDGACFAVGRTDGTVRPYRWPDCAFRYELKGPPAAIRDLAFSPDGARLAICQDDDAVRVVDVAASETRAVVRGHGEACLRAAWSPDGRWLATCGSPAARISTPDGALVATCPHGSGAVFSVAFSPDSARLLTGGAGPGVRLWSVEGRELASYDGHSSTLTMAGFSADGARVLTAGWDSARVWTTRHPEELWHDTALLACRISTDGSVLAAGLGTGEVVLHRRDGRRVRFNAHRSRVWDLWFTPDGTGLLTTSHDGSVKRWDLQHPDRGPVWEWHAADMAFKAAVSPDGRWLAVAHGKGVSEFDIALGTERQLGLRRCLAVAYDKDGSRLAASDEMRRVHVLDRARGTWGSALDHGAMIDSLAFAPDQDLLAVGTFDGRIALWEGDRRLATLRHDARVTRLAFSPDGGRLASGSHDGSVALWDVATRSCVARLVGHQGLVWAVDFCEQGRRLVSAASDGLVRLWPTDLEALVALARSRAWRELTPAENARYGVAPTLVRRGGGT